MEEWPEEVHPVEGRNLVCASTTKECEDVVLEFLQYFSSWFKLKTAVAWMLKVKSILLQLCRKRKELSAVKAQPEVERDMNGFKDSLFQGDTNKLTVENLAKAEEAIIHYSILTQAFGEEQRPLAFYSCKSDSVASGLPRCVQTCAAAAEAVTKSEDEVQLMM
uniref:Uncharacterized protein n=1 Tax=Neolamprologus brichardi TaxID=32507 RepID=A0A3Q4HB52_NEOBR